VIGRDPQNFKNDAIEAARLSELANTEAISSPTDQLFAEQFADMKREIQKLSRRQESPNAATSRSPTRERRVSFADDGQMAVRREYSRGRYVPRGQRSPQSFVPPSPRFNQYPRYGQYSQFSSRYPQFVPRGGRLGFYNPRPQQNMRLFRPRQSFAYRPTYNSQNQICNKCGGSLYASIMFCPAINIVHIGRNCIISK